MRIVMRDRCSPELRVSLVTAASAVNQYRLIASPSAQESWPGFCCGVHGHASVDWANIVDAVSHSLLWRSAHPCARAGILSRALSCLATKPFTWRRNVWTERAARAAHVPHLRPSGRSRHGRHSRAVTRAAWTAAAARSGHPPGAGRSRGRGALLACECRPAACPRRPCRALAKARGAFRGSWGARAGGGERARGGGVENRVPGATRCAPGGSSDTGEAEPACTTRC